MSTADALRQMLKEDKCGKNLYSHLTETLMKILMDKPTNAYDQFELVSADVKLNPFNPDPVVGRAMISSPEEIAAQTIWINQSANLLQATVETEEDSSVTFPDLMEECYLWDCAGISIGRSEVYRLYLSIRKLAETLPAEVGKLRFFGQISTTGKEPYIIVEGLNPEDEEDINESLKEGRNGANKYCYWVARTYTSSVHDWVKLPNITSNQIVKARLFKKFLTGDLNAPVLSYPIFPGNEANLLRTQIGRIAGATLISPEGFFDIEDDDDAPNVKEADSDAINERFPKLSNELTDPETWKHHFTDYNSIGRTSMLPEVLDANGDIIEVEDGVDVTVAAPLASIKPEEWTFRLTPGGAGVGLGSTAVARSLTWPGAVAVVAGKRFINIYTGHGIVYSKTKYSPPYPSAIQNEWQPPTESERERARERGEGEGIIFLVEESDILEDPIVPMSNSDIEDDEE